MSSRASALAVAACLAVVLVGADASAVECRLGPDGSITTWLIAGPFPLDKKAGFAKDLLPARAGEASGHRRVEGEGRAKWRGEASGVLVNLGPRCLERGESVFYAACELRATESGTYTLRATYWSKFSAWLDGKPILEKADEQAVMPPRKSGAVTFEKGRTHHLLLKLASSNRQAFFNLAITSNDGKRTPAPVRCVLRVPARRTGELLAQALTLSAPGGSVVRADNAVLLSAAARAGCPALKGEVTVRARIVDHKGQVVRAFDPAKMDAADLPQASVSLAWVIPKDTTAPYYVVQADVIYGGKKAGELRKVLYIPEGLSAWMQGLGERLKNVELQLGLVRRHTEPDVAFAYLKLEKAELRAQGEGSVEDAAAGIVEELEACDHAIARLEKHRRRPAEKGLSEHAYLSTVDDSPQPHYVYVPKKHDGRTRLPTLVYLHGYNPDLDKLNWEMIPRELLDYCDQYGFYLVAPFARSNTDFQGIGETDVIQVFQRFAQQYPIDADRVFLFGYSMGAMGAFTIGAHYPDVWAGIVSVSGRADYYLWKDLDREKVEPYKRHLIDTEFGAEMVGNYRSLPILMYHGGADSLVKVEQPRRLFKRLKEMGADVTLHELPGEDHWIMSKVLADDSAFKWMTGRKRNQWPAEVDFTTRTIKYRQSYWVTVLEMVRWGGPVRVHAKFNADRSALDVTTQNVASLRLDLSKKLVGEEPNLVVKVNGKEHQVEEAGPATFDVEPTKPVGKLRKTPRLCGPVKAAYNRRFVVVAGLGAGRQQDVVRFKSEIQRAAVEWYLFTKSTVLVKADNDLTAPDIRRSNLILYGTPSNNTKLKEIADKLPIKVTDEGFEFRGKTYSNKEHGLVMVYPNPLNPTRLVVVRSGLPYGGKLSPNHKFDLLPDFVIFKKGTDYDGTDKAVVAGFFDENWQVAERLIWRRGNEDPDPRLKEPAPLDKPAGDK